MKLTLADLQEERDRLRSQKAANDYRKALDATCSHGDLMAAAQGCRKTIDKMLEGMIPEVASALRGEHDETRLHFLLSDIAMDAVRSLGRALQQSSTTLPAMADRIHRGAMPRKLMTVSQWSDKHRWIVTGTNAPGRWKTELTPYLRDIMDDLSEHSPVRQVAFMKSSGVGGSEALFNFLGYIMHHLANKDTLLVVPTLELRDRSFNPRIRKMMSETPVLKALIPGGSRDKKNRDDIMEYNAMARVIKAGANSPDSLRADHLPYAICDEIDAFPWDVGGEGDPMTLIENRQRTFSRAKTYLVSTPTREQESRIEQAYKRSDQRKYFVPCPHCGERQTLDFTAYPSCDQTAVPHGLKWRIAPPDTDTGEVGGAVDQVLDAWYVCKYCHKRIDEGHKGNMLALGRWIAARPSVKLYRGYHINSLYAPIGLGNTWKQICQKFLNVQRDTSELKAFVNTTLGLTFAEAGEEVDASPLLLRREKYEEAHLPVCLRTAGVDVQKDRLEATVMAWGENEEGWALDHIILPGDTLGDEVWEELDLALTGYQVDLACVDSGYNTDRVYTFCDKRKWAIPTKGIEGARPLVEDDRRRKQRQRIRRRKGIGLEPIGVDQGKALVYARLRLAAPGKHYLHFHDGEDCFGQEYFDQLTAEKLVQRIRGGRVFTQWVKHRTRNEALDCMVLNLAALRLWGKPLKYVPPALDAVASAKGAADAAGTVSGKRGGRQAAMESATDGLSSQKRTALRPQAPVHSGFGSDNWNL